MTGGVGVDACGGVEALRAASSLVVVESYVATSEKRAISSTTESYNWVEAAPLCNSSLMRLANSSFDYMVTKVT